MPERDSSLVCSGHLRHERLSQQLAKQSLAFGIVLLRRHNNVEDARSLVSKTLCRDITYVPSGVLLHVGVPIVL